MSEDNGEYICLINEKEQYSVWFAWKEIQLACKQVAPKGSKEEVLKYVKKYGLTWDQKASDNKLIKALNCRVMQKLQHIDYYILTTVIE